MATTLRSLKGSELTWEEVDENFVNAAAIAVDQANSARAAAIAASTPIAHNGAGGLAHSEAVADGDAGFLSGADKAKLDSIGNIALGGISFPTVTIDQTTPDSRFNIPDTNPAGWNTDIGRMTLDFNFRSNDYFASNPNGHFAVVLRNTSSLIATAVRGQGILMGNGTGFSQPSSVNPTAMIETWMNSVAAAPDGNFLWNKTEVGNGLVLQDNVDYKFIVDATKTNEGNRYIRYRLWRKEAVSLAWRHEIDTGDVLDHNTWADLTQSGLVFGHVFGSNLVPWSIVLTEGKVTWGPAEQATPDQTTKLSRYGGDVHGKVRFLGNIPGNVPIVLEAGDAIAFELTEQIKLKYNPTNYLLELNNGSVRHGYINTSIGADVDLGNPKVKPKPLDTISSALTNAISLGSALQHNTSFRFTAAGNNTVVIQPDSFWAGTQEYWETDYNPTNPQAMPIGGVILIGNHRVGSITISPGAGVTINTPDSLVVNKLHGKATLIKVAPNVWDLEGNLAVAGTVIAGAPTL